VSATATIRGRPLPVPPTKGWSTPVIRCISVPGGPTYQQHAFDEAIHRQYGVIPGVELRQRGIEDVLREVHDRLAGRPVHLCFDMDFFDPSCAPGVCTPTWGGVSAHEGLSMIAALTGLRFVSFDLNTVSPPHDVGGMTAYLAGCCMHQFLVLACKQLGLTAEPELSRRERGPDLKGKRIAPSRG
jgi:arginase family enzyme